ncbi:hypothetical protein CVD28_03685 [Bacillus sp. M6-12]|uniref:hypothetical protein n=1 Tax=Bacillus sp. M6-12 TaxID=2054166 RepID=UPI000C77C5EE|nr:hypothetical protein [Bacillus sp. M6-12]PLS19529.1 hypothetical protein CVD28_03685 [Bacillus sp. M6-12]
MKSIQNGIILKAVFSFKEKEEVCVASVVKGSQFQSGVGYLVLSPLPPFSPVCIDSSYVEMNSSIDSIMELEESVYPLYKGVYQGERKESNPWSVLLPNSEVYVLCTIESFVFKKDKGYVVVVKKEVDSEHVALFQGTFSYEPFIVDSVELQFELESYIPTIKEELNTF